MKTMFARLNNFGYKRTKLQAFGFYIAYLILIIVLGSLLGGIVGGVFFEQMTPEQRFATGVKIGTSIAILCSIGLSFLIIIQKQRYDFGYILLAVFSGVLALFGGGILGLIPAAFLTTIDSKKSVTNSGPQIRDVEATPVTPSQINDNTTAQ